MPFHERSSLAVLNFHAFVADLEPIRPDHKQKPSKLTEMAPIGLARPLDAPPVDDDIAVNQ
jgi:hypothetical protein